MKKNILVVTGGAGFVGTNLINELLRQKNYFIISLDDYSSGKVKNHIKSKRVKYINGHTKNFEIFFDKIKNKIHTIFHFGEFSRIFRSFELFDNCILSNSIGTKKVFSFCLRHKIKLIYSATSASLGNLGEDKNLSPYAFTKAKNLELLENLKKWFNFKYEVIYFYNVYGPSQICQGPMATVIGIFERQYLNREKLTIVKPGTQSRRFTHINDTIKVCIEAWLKNKCKHYSVFNIKSYSIIQVAKMFKSKIKYIPERLGERYASHLTNMNLSNKIYKRYGKINLKDYINNFLKKN